VFGELYYFDWNATDNQIEERKKITFKKLERTWWRDFDEIFNSWRELKAALVLTHQILMGYLLLDLFVISRRFVRIASAILGVMSPKLAEISRWGKEAREPWSFALIHEEFIARI